jgi:two-component system, LytTR family, sensor kinase
MALKTCPLFASIAIIPASLINSDEKYKFLIGIPFLLLLTAAIWGINISLIYIFDKWNWKSKISRFVLSEVFSALLVYSLLFLLKIGEKINLEPHTSDFKIPEKFSHFFPFLQVASVTAIILILIENVLLNYRKKTAESEVVQLKMNILEAQHAQLKNNLQPHFLFNSLSTLKSLIKSQPDKAQSYLLMLSDCLRYAVDSDQKEVCTIGEELPLCLNYLKMQQIRFGDALQFSIAENVNAISERKIPVFALQVCVENAIKHNNMSIEKPLIINIHSANDAIIISNNKQLKLQTEPSTGYGLTNLAKRYENFNSEQFTIENNATEFIVKLPFIN